MNAPPTEATTLAGLRKANVLVGLAHLAQALVILALATDFAIPVVAAFQDGPPGTALPSPETIFEVRYGWAVAAFLFLAAADHLLVASPPARKWYEANLRRGRNDLRWIEYSISASLMVVLIAMLTGITSAYALLGIFGVNAAMILFGLLMEHTNQPGEPVQWLPFSLGCVVGVIPWLAITLALGGSVQDGSEVPGFVFAIFVSLFLFFSSFAVVQWLQFRGRGRWSSYLTGERAYILLSLGAKSALAWQVFAGTLAD
jgi:hypothetical protein